MLSIEQCRKHLGEEGDDLSDEQVREIREAMREIAIIALEDMKERATQEEEGLFEADSM